MGVAALCNSLQKAEIEAPQSKLAKETSCINKLWVLLRDPTSRNKVQIEEDTIFIQIFKYT